MFEKVAQHGFANLHNAAQERHEARMRRLRGIKTDAELLAEWKAAHAELKQDRDKLFLQSVKNLAYNEGSQAQVNALKEALAEVAPNHPLLQASGQKYQDGKPKSKLRLVFEAACDAVLRKHNLHPRDYRKD